MTGASAAAARRLLNSVVGDDVAHSAPGRLTAYIASLPSQRRREVVATGALVALAPDIHANGSMRPLRRPQHLARTLAYAAHYSDTQRRLSLHYAPLESLTSHSVVLETDTQAQPPTDVDACVIGAGAAGTIIAEHLARSGRSVVLLEQGSHHQFTDDPDEVAVLASVYRDGALQLSSDKGLTILQASGLGGSTIVNNGICTYPGDPALSPDRVNEMTRWGNQGVEIDPVAFDQARRVVERRLSVGELPASVVGRNAALLLAPGPAHDAAAPAAGVFRTNLAGCLGCGLCNYGCPHGRRVSVVDAYIVGAVQQGLRVVTEARVTGIEQRPRGVAVHASLGSARGNCSISARTVVVASGAISSSALLERSRLGGQHVGTRLSHNLSFPVLARMPSPVRAHTEVPMSAYVDHGPYILESIFFPPAAFAALLPEWGRAHRESMEAYDHFAGAAVLTRTRAAGRVLAARYRDTTSPRIISGLGEPDRTASVMGLRQLSRHFFGQGAEYLLFPTLPWSGRVRTLGEVEVVLGQLKRAGRVSLSTAHPQGGNPLHPDPDRGAVDLSFRLHGTPSVYVCDASIFPGALGINPQLTVMSLAEMCGNVLAGRDV